MEPSDSTRALIRAYRASIEPPPGTRERQLARVHERLAAPPPARRRRIWGTVVAVAALFALALTGLGFYIEARVQRAVDASLAEHSETREPVAGATLQRATPTTPATTVTAPPAEPAPAEAPPGEPPPAAPAADPTPVATATPAAPATRRRPRPAAPVLDADSLRLEGVLLSQARDALARGDWSRVLSLVDEHRRQHPQGALLEERLVCEAAAACEAGLHERGQTALGALKQRFPGSLALARVEAACAGHGDE